MSDEAAPVFAEPPAEIAEIEVSFTPTYDELLDGAKLAVGPFDFLVQLGVLAAAGVAIVAFGTFDAFHIAMYAAVVAFSFYNRARRNRAVAGSVRRCTLRFGAHWMLVEPLGIPPFRVALDAMHLVENEQTFVLRMQRTHLTLPKRVFASPDELAKVALRLRTYTSHATPPLFGRQARDVFFAVAALLAVVVALQTCCGPAPHARAPHATHATRPTR